MKRPLFIIPAYSHPHDAVGQIARRFVRNLGTEFAPTVITRNFELNTSYGNIHKIQENNIYFILERILRKFKLHEILQTPDYLRYSWNNNVFKYFKNNLDSHKFDYIHSISNPCSSHLTALQIKKYTGLPWIAEFYDPWRDNPIRRFHYSYFDKLDSKLEKSVAENADLIIHSNEKIIDIWANRYGNEIRKKIHIMPFIVDKPMIGNIIKENNDQLIISHIGNFQKERNSRTFIEAIQMLVEEEPQIRKKIKVNYVGRVTKDEIFLIEKYKLNDIFNILGFLSEQECLPYFNSTDIFLAIDTNNDNNVFYPSKIIKYFVFKKPILGIVTNDSVLERELKKSGNSFFSYNDVKGIKEYLKKIILGETKINTNDTKYGDNFLPENVMRIYKSLTDEICK